MSSYARRDLHAATTTPLSRRHYEMLDTDEVRLVHEHRGELRRDLRRAATWRYYSMYAGATIVLLALLLAIIVMKG